MCVGMSKAAIYKVIFMIFVVMRIGAGDNEKPKARLLFAKQILNKQIVEGLDLVVKYTLYNVGSGAAYNIQISDDGFNSQSFSTHFGHVDVRIFTIPAGRNVSHTVVLRPTSPGIVNISTATVVYQKSVDPEDLQIGSSNEPGSFVVESFAVHKRRNSSHIVEWCYFTGLTLVIMFVSKRNGFFR